MPIYVMIADVNEQEFQNVQELSSIWGEIRTDIEKLGGELVDSYALLGEHDFLVVFEVDAEDDAFEIAIAVERYGLDTETMPARSTDRLGELVDDI